jgi:hypothetical protein
MSGNEPVKPDEGVQKQGGNQDPKTWKIVNMKNPPEKFKIVDDANKNIATDFTTQAKAQQYVDYYMWKQDHPEPPQPMPVEGGLDENGVKMLFPSKQGGPAYFYKMTDNIEGSKFIETDGNKATQMTDGAITFQRLKSDVVHYSSMPDGKTCRVNINGGGFISKQAHTWKDNPTPEFIWTPNDSKNYEFTYYFRANGKMHEHTECSTKNRGGIHTGSNDPHASTFELSLKIGQSELKCSKEYNHPDYEFDSTTKASDNLSHSDKWIARKTVVWTQSDGNVNAEDYVDWDPFDVAGKPKNNFVKLQSKVFKSTSKYPKAPTWGGMATSRIDGHNSIDYSIISIREIIPPS